MDSDTMPMVIIVLFVFLAIFILAGACVMIRDWHENAKDRKSQLMPMPGIQTPQEQIDKQPTTPLEPIEATPPIPMREEHLLFIQIAGYLRVERLKKELEEDYGQCENDEI